MNNIVGIIKGKEKIRSLNELLFITKFDDVLLQEFDNSGFAKEDFKIAIKPNMMVFIHKDISCTYTDKELVEYLVDHIIALGFRNISVCEAQNDVGRMLKNHTVHFVASQIGYSPKERYKIVDMTHEAVPHRFFYKDKNGKTKYWKDKIGKTWRDANFRVTFAKCKTHEHDWMTLGVKNIYGCFPSPEKIAKYHIKNEIFDVTARLLLNFPVHFSFVDAWVASDGFQGYKLGHPKELNILFGGNNCVAVDMEIFKRAGLNPRKSKILKKLIEQLDNGGYPEYAVVGDTNTDFKSICDWENIDDSIVEKIDKFEEVYISWGFLNLKAITVVDYQLFPAKNSFYRSLIWFSRKLYAFFKLFRFYRKIYK